MDTDALLDRAGAGDTHARDQLLVQHRERLKQMICFRLDPRLAARIDSSDVVQETLASAAQRLGQYLQSRPLPFYPWLRQIAWDKLVELHRFHLRRKRSIAREQPIEIRLSDQSVSELANCLVPRVLSVTGWWPKFTWFDGSLPIFPTRFGDVVVPGLSRDGRCKSNGKAGRTCD